MSPRAKGNRPLTLQERTEIMLRAERQENDTQIAAALQLSVAVVRKWRRKARDQGRAGLVTSLGRPPSGPLGHFAKELRAAVKEMRAGHAGWGAGTLRVELAHDPRFANLPVPSCSRLAAYLKSEKMTRPYGRHTELTNPVPQKLLACHEEWEMDAQGVCKVAVGSDDVGAIIGHVMTPLLCKAGAQHSQSPIEAKGGEVMERRYHSPLGPEVPF